MIPARTVISGLALLTMLVAGCGQSPLAARAASGKRPVAVAARGVPAGYYAPVEGQQGRELLQGLHRLVSRHKDLGYDVARDMMFGKVDDLDGDDVVECIYIGRTLDHVKDRHSAFRNGGGLNAEHTWPQSKGAEGAAKADLHHLFPSDIKANATRGSHPFGEVVRSEWAGGGSELGTDARGNTVFEPRREQRGDTARAILYFYTVYGLAGSAELENFRIEEPVLKKWHQEDPPTEAERARNDAIFAVQANRNPYVDRPEFVAKIGTFYGEARR